MSTSDIYILNHRSVTHYQSFQNGWGSGPACWDYLGQKYLDDWKGGWTVERYKPVWALARDNRLSQPERVALAFTFDKSFIPLDKLLCAGNNLILFGEMSQNGNFVNHWRAFGQCLKQLADETHHHKARGAVLSCTSVSDVWCEPSNDYLDNAWSIYADETLKIAS